MWVARNSKPSVEPDCDHCRRQTRFRRASTYRVRIDEHCIAMWLCDEHADKAVRQVTRFYDASREDPWA